MEDKAIVDLYWARDEQAITETQKKFAAYLSKIAYNILYDREDTEESVNDTYLRAWNSMPENRPKVLSTYLGKIIRRLSIDRYRKKHAQKRGESEYALSLEEMREDLGLEAQAPADVEGAAIEKELADLINRWLAGRPERERNIFLSRYYFLDAVTDIAGKAGMKEGTVRSILFRERAALKEYLEKEGYAVG